LVGKRSFFSAISALETLEFGGETDIGKAVANCPSVGANDGLSVIISDFFTNSDWKKAVDYLTYKKRQVLLIQTLAPEEAEPLYSGRYDLIDAEAKDLMDGKNMRLRITRSMQLAYEQAMNEIYTNLKSFCDSRGANFISVHCDKAIEDVVFKELLKVGIMA